MPITCIYVILQYAVFYLDKILYDYTWLEKNEKAGMGRGA